VLKIYKYIFENQDYRGHHRAPSRASDDSPLYDVTENGTFPENFYTISTKEASQYVLSGDSSYDYLCVNLVRSYYKKPNKKIKIYRSVPKSLKTLSTQKEIDDLLSYKQLYMKKGDKYAFNKTGLKFGEILDKIDYLNSIIGTEKEKKSIQPKINPGDWVTPFLWYAKQHGESNLNNNFIILSKTVFAKDIYNEGSLLEWGYDPA
jgi:hypothetical protein